MKYLKPIFWLLDEKGIWGQYPCWNGGVACGAQCGTGGSQGRPTCFPGMVDYYCRE